MTEGSKTLGNQSSPLNSTVFYKNSQLSRTRRVAYTWRVGLSLTRDRNAAAFLTLHMLQRDASPASICSANVYPCARGQSRAATGSPCPKARGERSSSSCEQQKDQGPSALPAGVKPRARTPQRKLILTEHLGEHTATPSAHSVIIICHCMAPGS